MKTLVCLLLLCVPGFAQTPKQKIYFQCTCNDPVGSRLATKLRDLIAQSPRYSRSESDFGGADEKYLPVWSIRIVTKDVDGSGDRSVMAIAITQGLFLRDLYVLSCGSEKVTECAEGTLADLDSRASK
jgi:hypothetical protein